MRESVPKGAGLTGHTVGAHLDADGLAVGEFLDDRVQEHNHRIRGSEQNVDLHFHTDNTSGGLAGFTYKGVQSQNELVARDVFNARAGATTEVKSVGVNYIIKAKMIGVPADFMAKVDEAVEDVYGAVIPSDASASNKLVTESDVDYFYQTSDVEGEYDANDFAVVGKITRYCVKSPVHGYQVNGTAWWGFYETVCFRDGGYGYQTFRTMLGTPAMAIRQLYNGSWGGWQKLVTESDLSDVFGVYEYTSSNAPTKASFINLLVSSNAHMDFKFINVTADYTPNASSYWYIQKFGGTDALHIKLLATDWVSGDLYIGDANSANNTITWWRLAGTQV
jgi:hypothetical protein